MEMELKMDSVFRANNWGYSRVRVKCGFTWEKYELGEEVRSP